MRGMEIVEPQRAERGNHLPAILREAGENDDERARERDREKQRTGKIEHGDHLSQPAPMRVAPFIE